MGIKFENCIPIRFMKREARSIFPEDRSTTLTDEQTVQRIIHACWISQLCQCSLIDREELYYRVMQRSSLATRLSHLILVFFSLSLPSSLSFSRSLKRKEEKKSRCETTPGCVSFREIYGIIKVCCDLWSVVPIMKRILFLFPFLFLLEGNETSINRSSIYPRVNAFK